MSAGIDCRFKKATHRHRMSCSTDRNAGELGGAVNALPGKRRLTGAARPDVGDAAGRDAGSPADTQESDRWWASILLLEGLLLSW